MQFLLGRAAEPEDYEDPVTMAWALAFYRDAGRDLKPAV